MKKPPLRAFLLLTCLFLFVTATVTAFIQQPWPDPFHSPKFPQSVLYPIEFNVLQRLAVVTADLRDVFVVPDTEKVWAVGSNGMILHSDDAGARWEQQVVDFGRYTSPTKELPKANEGAFYYKMPKIGG
ncbi:MAG TPA: hypothetical protein VJL89_01095 [Thermodesulfovibrionia bacterium]|nr:hypothetical protein [Thermodesulfovibrionia bacterium]